MQSLKQILKQNLKLRVGVNLSILGVNIINSKMKVSKSTAYIQSLGELVKPQSTGIHLWFSRFKQELGCAYL